MKNFRCSAAIERKCLNEDCQNFHYHKYNGVYCNQGDEKYIFDYCDYIGELVIKFGNVVIKNHINTQENVI
jgi:hypothetical protein